MIHWSAEGLRHCLIFIYRNHHLSVNLVSLASYGQKQQSSRIAHKRAKPDRLYIAYDDAYVISTSVPTSSLLQTYDLMLLSHLENHIPLLPVPKTPHTNNEANHTLLALLPPVQLRAADHFRPLSKSAKGPHHSWRAWSAVSNQLCRQRRGQERAYREHRSQWQSSWCDHLSFCVSAYLIVMTSVRCRLC
jgi:hypothetical protein